MAAEADLSTDDLRALAEKVDAGENIDTDTGEAETVSLDAPADQDEAPTQDEIEKAAEAADKKDDSESSDTTAELKKPSKEEKEAERYDRNWKKLQERQAEIEARAKEVEEREAKLTKTRDIKDEVDGDGYSVKDYEFATKKFRDDGDEVLALKAEKAGRDLYVKAFNKVWQSNMNEMIDQYPDLSDSRKPFTQACDKVLSSLPFLKAIPDGCKYAVRIALGDTSSTMVSELKAENQKLKKEVEAFRKSGRLSGSLPSKMPGGKSFDDMSSNERLSHLRELADAADREGL